MSGRVLAFVGLLAVAVASALLLWSRLREEPRPAPEPRGSGSAPARPVAPETLADLEALAAGDGRFPEGYVPERLRPAGERFLPTTSLGGALVAPGDSRQGDAAASVQAVEAGSWADHLGVRVGDRILEIDGSAVTPRLITAVAASIQAGLSSPRLRVERGSEVIDLPAGR